MLNGGRIWQHLRFHGGKSNNKLLIVGYQADGTYGRELLDGKRDFIIDDKEIHLKLQVVKLEGFSGHADQKMLLSWLNDLLPQSAYRGEQKIQLVLIHGEEGTRDVLESQIKDKFKIANLIILKPEQAQEFTLWE